MSARLLIHRLASRCIVGIVQNRGVARIGERRPGKQLDVPDPYHGGPDGLEEVLGLVERACEGLLERLRRRG